jgi:hypothetical protein
MHLTSVFARGCGGTEAKNPNRGPSVRPPVEPRGEPQSRGVTDSWGSLPRSLWRFWGSQRPPLRQILGIGLPPDATAATGPPQQPAANSGDRHLRCWPEPASRTAKEKSRCGPNFQFHPSSYQLFEKDLHRLLAFLDGFAAAGCATHGAVVPGLPTRQSQAA